MASRIYQSTHTGDELDKAIDYMNSHEQAIQDGLQEIENAGNAKKEEISGITQAQAVGYTPSPSSGLSSKNVQDALNEAGGALQEAGKSLDELSTAVDNIDNNVQDNTQKLSELGDINDLEDNIPADNLVDAINYVSKNAGGGLSAYAISLLKAILDKGVYTEDVKSDINDLIEELKKGGGGGGGSFVMKPTIEINDYRVTIKSDDVNVTIYYTIDGSNPTNESNEYSIPFKPKYDCVVKAVAYKDGQKSKVSSADYVAEIVAYIEFEDTSVLKPLVLSLCDTDADGEIKPEEAATVSSIGTKFKGTAISSFDEFRYFTNVKKLDFQAFSGCTSLRSIRLPEGLEMMDNQCFANCSSLQTIYIPDSVTTMCNCFSGGMKFKIEGNKLPSNLSSFKGYYDESLSFRNNTELELDELPENIPFLPDLSGCSKITLRKLPVNIKDFSKNLRFSGCSSLLLNDIPEGFTDLGQNAFKDCSSLTSMTLPTTMTSISGEWVFLGCTSLTKLTLKANQVVVLGRASYDTIPDNIVDIFVPANLVDAYKADSKWGSLPNAATRIKAIE